MMIVQNTVPILCLLTLQVTAHWTPGLVDLGYAKHVPTYINTTSSGHRVAIYENIRFANPPTGDLRFRAPDTNLPIVQGIQDGRVPWASRDCIASAPSYLPFPVNGTWGHEDCLFLDVYVPEGVRPGDNVPVLHYFFGSAYAFGSKNVMVSPMGLFERMFTENAGKFIFVINNYRLGMPGWTYAAGEDMDANLGILDCLAAAEWTAKFIDRFGGNSDQYTVIGESAGAGMLYYMTTLHGGEGTLPFQQAFISSPAAPLRRDVAERQRELFELVLTTAGCTSLECLRAIPEDKMLAVNDQLINQTPSMSGGGYYGALVGFGPAPDGKALPDMPLALYKEGRFHKNFKGLIIGTMANEGKTTSHDTGMPDYFPVLVREQLPAATNATVAAIQNEYYDPANPPKMAWDWTTDTVFACNAYNLANALPWLSNRYIMSTPPATHGEDLSYYFYNDNSSTPIENCELARQFQLNLLRFVHGRDLDWPKYGAQKEIFNITDRFEATTLPDDLKKRCDTLNSYALDPANGA